MLDDYQIYRDVDMPSVDDKLPDSHHLTPVEQSSFKMSIPSTHLLRREYQVTKSGELYLNQHLWERMLSTEFMRMARILSPRDAADNRGYFSFIDHIDHFIIFNKQLIFIGQSQ